MRILIESLGGLGNNVMRRSFIHQATRIFKGSEIILLTLRNNQPVFQDIKVEKIFAESMEQVEATIYSQKKLREKFDIFFRLSFRTFNFEGLHLIKYSEERSLVVPGPGKPQLRRRSIALYNGLQMLSEFGPVKFEHYALKIKEQDVSDFIKKMKFGKKRTKIAIFPWSSKAGKNWKLEKFIKLARILAEKNKGFEIYILGTLKNGKEFSVKEQPKNIKILVNKTTVADAIYFIRKMDLVIANDSGPIHIADNLGVACLGLYSSKTKKLFWPVNLNSHVLAPETSKLDDLKIADVYDHAIEIINEVKKFN